MLKNNKLTLIPAAYKDSKVYSQIPLNGDGDFTFTRTSSATRVNSKGFIEVVDSNIPRLDYSNGKCPELLLERASTNLALHSQEFANWTQNNGAVVSSNVDVSPSGELNADKITFDGSSEGRVNRTITTVDGEAYTMSVWLKNYDLEDETQVWIGFSNTSQGEFVTITNEWVRYSVTKSANSTSEFPRIQYTGDGSLFAWGFQVEQTDKATSYIPTSGAISTRSIDRLDDLTSIDVSNDNFTLLVDVDYTDLTDSFGCISINDGDDDNNLRIMNIISSDEVRVTNRVSSTGVNNYNIFHSTWGYKLKIGIVSTDNGIDIYVNGDLASSETSGRIDMSGMTNIGFTDGAGDNFLGRLKELKYYNTNLSEQELITLTK